MKGQIDDSQIRCPVLLAGTTPLHSLHNAPAQGNGHAGPLKGLGQ